jgi:hypothetical protein
VPIDTFVAVAGTTALLFGLLVISGALPQIAVLVTGIPFNATLLPRAATTPSHPYPHRTNDVSRRGLRICSTETSPTSRHTIASMPPPSSTIALLGLGSPAHGHRRAAGLA